MQMNDAAMTFDDLYMQRSKGFVNALQELKNLRPQLYSAAEYCEKTYLHNEQKQMVLDNLKEYAVRALVNAVDHLGTVAYKLTDLCEQQTSEVSNVELKVSCLSQQICTCKTDSYGEGLRQQKMFSTTTRHHKHYILPNYTRNHNHVQGKHQPHSSRTAGSKTLSWHLASDANSVASEAYSTRTGDSKFSKVTVDVFHLLKAEEPSAAMPLSSHLQTSTESPTSDVRPDKYVIKESIEAVKPVSGFNSFNYPGQLQVYRAPIRSRSMFSAFFAKNKTFKPRKVLVS